MKTKELFRRTLLVLIALLGTLTASAYDFSAENADATVYYKAAHKSTNVLQDYTRILQEEIEYGIEIGGIEVTEHNAADITGDCITRGTVSFDPETHVLTLTDATIEGGAKPCILLKDDYYTFDDFTIKLVGYNILKADYYCEVGLGCNTTITGPGKLVMNDSGNLYDGTISLYKSCELSIEGGCTIKGLTISGGYNGNGILTVKGDYTQVELTFGIIDFANVILLDGLYYEKPKGGHYDTNNHYMVDSLGNRWNNGVIIKRENPIPYVIYHGDLETLTFYNDGQMPGHLSGVTVAYFLNEGDDMPEWYNDGRNEYITKAIIDESFASARPTTTSNWFAEMYNLTSIEGTEYLNTCEVTDMGGMFWECGSLPYVDLSSFDTHNVTDMHSMFAECYELTGIDVSGFDTQNVTDMGGMFSDCSELTSLDLSNFNTAKVTDMYSMFGGCGLTTLDLSSFDTHNVTDMSYMFSYCSEMQTIYVGDGWSTAAVTYSDVMFYNCINLVGGKGTTYSDSNPLDKTYAHVDGGPSDPGYFSEKGGTFLRGDVNGDGSVNISDVTALIDYLLSGNASGINLSGADCNQDSSVNISDVTSLIDYLLSGQWP